MKFLLTCLVILLFFAFSRAREFGRCSEVDKLGIYDVNFAPLPLQRGEINRFKLSFNPIEPLDNIRLEASIRSGTLSKKFEYDMCRKQGCQGWAP